jgi:hypothetical protein
MELVDAVVALDEPAVVADPAAAVDDLELLPQAAAMSAAIPTTAIRAALCDLIRDFSLPEVRALHDSLLVTTEPRRGCRVKEILMRISAEGPRAQLPGGDVNLTRNRR